MRCSVVIRAYNESRHIGRLLEGIASQTCGEVEVIVVDSGSTDGTLELAQASGAKIVHIAPQDFTFGRSLNRGIAVASCGLVVIASAHVYPVYPDWIERLLLPFRDPSIALVYGKQRGNPNSRFSEQQIFRQWYPDADIPRQANAFCNNANAAVRRLLWEEHPYDESLTGLEDLAWASWALSRGRGISYSAQAEVVHIHEETPRRVYDRYRREGMAFKRIFPESHFNAYDFVRLTLANTMNDLAQARRERVLWRCMSSILWFRTAQFWGTYQGYRHSSAVTQALRQRFYYPPASEQQISGDRGPQPIRYNESGLGNGQEEQGRP